MGFVTTLLPASVFTRRQVLIALWESVVRIIHPPGFTKLFRRIKSKAFPLSISRNCTGRSQFTPKARGRPALPTQLASWVSFSRANWLGRCESNCEDVNLFLYRDYPTVDCFDLEDTVKLKYRVRAVLLC